MKKTILSILLSLSVFINLATPVFATTNLGTLYFWDSDGTEIGRWDESSLKIYNQKLNSTNNSFIFLVGMEYACEQWDDVLGITLSSSSNYSYNSAPIQYHGGTLADINSYGVFTLTSSYNGATLVSSNVEGRWKYRNVNMTGRVIRSVIGCIVDNNRTPDEYKKTCTHEVGHALGWLGHSPSYLDVMYSAGSSITSLTERDERHLSQVYD